MHLVIHRALHVKNIQEHLIIIQDVVLIVQLTTSSSRMDNVKYVIRAPILILVKESARYNVLVKDRFIHLTDHNALIVAHMKLL